MVHDNRSQFYCLSEQEEKTENTVYSWAERTLLREKCEVISTTDPSILHHWLARVFHTEEDGYQPPGNGKHHPPPSSDFIFSGEDVDKLELVREESRSPRTNHSVHFKCPDLDRN